MLKKLMLVSILTVSILFSFTSCSSETPEPERKLAGSWLFITAPDGSTDNPGNFNATQTYMAEIPVSFLITVTFEVYTGTATINGDLYSCSGSLVKETNDVTFEFSQVSDTDADRITFEGNLSGYTVTGTYTGEGAYADGTTGTYSGTFTAIK